MKYLLLSFFYSLFAFGQNESATLTAYRLIDEYDDGPCSIKTYIENPDEFFFSYVTAESNDPWLVKKLLDIKKQSKKWKSSAFNCSPSTVGGDMIHNMIVLRYGQTQDTIFCTENNQSIVFPKERISRLDENHVVSKALTHNIREFFAHDFKKQIRAPYLDKFDSIPDTRITFKDRPAYVYMVNDFQRNLGDSTLISKDSLYNHVHLIYKQNKDTIKFHEGLYDIILRDASDWNVAGLKPGDSEKVLLDKYPESTDIQLYYHVRFEDIKRMYFYVVKLIDNKGSIAFFIKDHVIEYIRISFR